MEANAGIQNRMLKRRQVGSALEIQTLTQPQQRVAGKCGQGV